MVTLSIQIRGSNPESRLSGAGNITLSCCLTSCRRSSALRSFSSTSSEVMFVLCGPAFAKRSRRRGGFLMSFPPPFETSSNDISNATGELCRSGKARLDFSPEVTRGTTQVTDIRECRMCRLEVGDEYSD